MTTPLTQPSTPARAADQAAQVGSTATSAAGDVAGTAASSGAEVAGVAKQQTAQVLGESIDQAKDLASTIASTVQHQLASQSDRVGEHLAKLSTQLTEGDTSGMVGQVMTEAGQRLRGLADHIQQAGPDGVLHDLRSYARRSPGSFLLGAAAAGVVAGRLMKGLQGASSGTPSASTTPTTPEPTMALPPAPPVPVVPPVPPTPQVAPDPYPPTTVMGAVVPGGTQ